MSRKRFLRIVYHGMIFFLLMILYFLKFFILFNILQVKNPSIANCFEAIFASITWEERSYIYRYLSQPFRYTEEKVQKLLNDYQINWFILLNGQLCRLGVFWKVGKYFGFYCHLIVWWNWIKDLTKASDNWNQTVSVKLSLWAWLLHLSA